jgi:hypothetical protein
MRVTRSGGNNTLSLLVFLAATGSTAGNATDHASIPGSVTIPAGAATVDITITPIDDALVEGAETVVRTVSANANYIVGSPSQATVTIADNESLPTVTISATDPNASESGPDAGTMRVTRSGGNNTLSLLVFLAATGSTAGNATDHASIPGSVTIPAGAATVDITITPIDDALVEGAETVVRTVSANTNYIVGSPSQATVTIADND